MDDLVIVAVLDADFAKRAARDDLEIALNRDAKRVKAKLVQHIRDAESSGHSAVFAVHPDRESPIESH
jgi:hypothetical protein